MEELLKKRVQNHMEIYLNEEEREDTKKIMSCGTSVFMQQLPTTKREELKL